MTTKRLADLVMLTIIAMFVCVLTFGIAHTSAQTSTLVGAMQPVAHETDAPTTGTAIQIGALIRNPASIGQTSRCLIGPVETNSIRYWMSGAVPTSTVGHLIPVAGFFYLNGAAEINQFWMIGASGTASVPVECER